MEHSLPRNPVRFRSGSALESRVLQSISGCRAVRFLAVVAGPEASLAFVGRRAPGGRCALGPVESAVGRVLAAYLFGRLSDLFGRVSCYGVDAVVGAAGSSDWSRFVSSGGAGARLRGWLAPVFRSGPRAVRVPWVRRSRFGVFSRLALEGSGEPLAGCDSGSRSAESWPRHPAWARPRLVDRLASPTREVSIDCALRFSRFSRCRPSNCGSLARVPRISRRRRSAVRAV